MESIETGGLMFEIRRSARRRTVSITVDRDGSLLLHAPDNAALSQLRQAAATKAEWVHGKLAEKELLLHGRDPHQYVSGEGFHYLGRTYRLRLVDRTEGPPLRLVGGWFELRRDEHDQAASHFRSWYIRNGRRWLQRRTERWGARMQVPLQEVDVRDLGHRWGSCSLRAVNFHWRSAVLPPRIADYVIVHELAHVHHPRHDAMFWRAVERAMPDYRERKAWLAQHGAML